MRNLQRSYPPSARSRICESASVPSSDRNSACLGMTHTRAAQNECAVNRWCSVPFHRVRDGGTLSFMTDADTHQSNDPVSSRSWLPSPGCLFGATLLVIVAAIGVWIGWRVHRQQARLEYFEAIQLHLNRVIRENRLARRRQASALLMRLGDRHS